MPRPLVWRLILVNVELTIGASHHVFKPAIAIHVGEGGLRIETTGQIGIDDVMSEAELGRSGMHDGEG